MIALGFTIYGEIIADAVAKAKEVIAESYANLMSGVSVNYASFVATTSGILSSFTGASFGGGGSFNRSDVEKSLLGKDTNDSAKSTKIKKIPVTRSQSQQALATWKEDEDCSGSATGWHALSMDNSNDSSGGRVSYCFLLTSSRVVTQLLMSK
jgi:hypothetical protein